MPAYAVGCPANGLVEGCLFEFMIILMLVLLNGLFAGAEIAIVALRQTRLLQLLEEKRTGAVALKTLRDKPEWFLATVQVGITVVNSTAAAFGGASLARPIASTLQKFPVLAPMANDIALAAVVALVSYLSVVFGELVPKSLALRGAESWSLVVARPLLLIARLTKPVVWLLSASSNLVLRPFGDRTTFSESRVSSDELHQMVEEAARSGEVEQHAGEIAARALEFADITARHVMVPRNRIHAIEENATQEELRRVLVEYRFARLPVYRGSLDNIRGYIAVKDVLACTWEEKSLRLDALLRPAFFVPHTSPATRVLEELRKRHLQLAFVVDEHGVLVGLITLEDLLEELVGELLSEHATTDAVIRSESNGTAVVHGSTSIREVNRTLGLELEEGTDYSTIAGLCMAVAGGIPERGRTLAVSNGTTVEILDASPTQVHLVRVHSAVREQPGERST